MTTSTYPQHLRTECPSWCTVEHTWDCPEFHASVLAGVDVIESDLDDNPVRARLFQAVEWTTPVVTVAGHTLTAGGARALADVLRMFADMAEGSVGR